MKTLNELILHNGESLYSVCKDTDVQVTQLSRWLVAGALVDVDGKIYIPTKTKSASIEARLKRIIKEQGE